MSENVSRRPRDLSYRVVCGLIIVVVIWLLLTPFVPAVAMSTMRRFQLASKSFAWWALQQPVPSMYNFANQTQVRSTPPGFPEPIISLADENDDRRWRYINHYPTRQLTFANARYAWLREGKDQWLETKTSYRGQVLTSVIHAKYVGEGKYEFLRENEIKETP